MVEYRIIWDYDPDPDFDWLSETEEDYRVLGPAVVDGKELTFSEYKQLLGSPEYYAVLYCQIKVKCTHCNEWSIKNSCYNVSFMVNDNYKIGEFKTIEEISNLYQQEVSADLLESVVEEIETVKLTK